MHQRLLINGKWTASARTAEVTNKYTGQVIATVAQAEESDVRQAVAAAEQAAPVMAATPIHRRAAWLARTAQLLDQGRAEVARVIAQESGKDGHPNGGDSFAALSGLEVCPRRLSGPEGPRTIRPLNRLE